MPDLGDALGKAYHLQVNGKRADALAAIRAAALTDRPGAESKLAELSSVVRARTQGNRCHAHVEKIEADLLAEALLKD